MKKKSSLKKKGASVAPKKADPITQVVAVVKEKPMQVPVVPSPPLIPSAPEVDFHNSFVLTEKGNLFPIILEPFYNGATPVHKYFNGAEEILDILLQNRQTLFGKNSLLINERKEKHLEWLGVFNFDGILFDFKEILNPKLYLAVITASEQNYVNLFFRITDYFAFNHHPQARKMIGEVLSKAVNENEELKKELQEKIGNTDITEFLEKMLWSKPEILLIMESYWQELPLFRKTYAETWGEFVKPMVIQKFARNGDALVAVAPSFETLRNGKKKKPEKVIRTTEEDHLKTASPMVKEVYQKIKTELIKEDISLEFNPKSIYISLRKARNLAFFHLRKQSIYLVVMCSEKEVRKAVKHYVIKTLPPSVQKFWNGECTGIVIEQPTNVQEIIGLLKKIIKQ